MLKLIMGITLSLSLINLAQAVQLNQCETYCDATDSTGQVFNGAITQASGIFCGPAIAKKIEGSKAKKKCQKNSNVPESCTVIEESCTVTYTK